MIEFIFIYPSDPTKNPSMNHLIEAGDWKGLGQIFGASGQGTVYAVERKKPPYDRAAMKVFDQPPFSTERRLRSHRESVAMDIMKGKLFCETKYFLMKHSCQSRVSRYGVERSSTFHRHEMDITQERKKSNFVDST
jgi:hypothetical protein